MFWKMLSLGIFVAVMVCVVNVSSSKTPNSEDHHKSENVTKQNINLDAHSTLPVLTLQTTVVPLTVTKKITAPQTSNKFFTTTATPELSSGITASDRVFIEPPNSSSSFTKPVTTGYITTPATRSPSITVIETPPITTSIITAATTSRTFLTNTSQFTTTQSARIAIPRMAISSSASLPTPVKPSTTSPSTITTSDSPKTTESSTDVTTTTEYDRPCDRQPYNPPDFKAANRTISEEKCLHHIWSMGFRQERIKRAFACYKWIQQHPEVLLPDPAVGGEDTKPGEFPHMGAIGWKAVVGRWVFKCGSSLISDKFLLTAAHCSKASPDDTTIADVNPKIVRLGDKNIIVNTTSGDSMHDYLINRFIIHPKYTPLQQYYDIALIELISVVSFTYVVQPACLWFKPDLAGVSQATLTGWGVVETGGHMISPELQKAVVEIVDNNTCDQLLQPFCNRYWCGVQDHQLCAGEMKGGVDACQGDSGGPLQVKIPVEKHIKSNIYYIVGVIAFGIGCGEPNTPGIYTRVSSFRDWIEGHVWGQ